MSVTIVLVAIVSRMSELPDSRHTGSGSSRFVNRPVAFVGMSILAVMLLHQQWPQVRASIPWDTYRRIALAEKHKQSAVATVDGATAEARLVEMHKQLISVVRCQPDAAQAHVRLASLCLERFDRQQSRSENAMTISQIRDAALASDFADCDALNEWLSLVVSDNRRYLDAALYHARRAADLSPMLGRAYVYLAELAFLDDPHTRQHESLIRQALLVRPYDGVVLFAAGQDAALRGDIETALAHWRTAFHAGVEYQSQLVRLLGSSLPVQQFIDFMKPQSSGLRTIYAYYDGIRDTASRDVVGVQLAAQLEADSRRVTGTMRLRKLNDAAHLFAVAGELDRSVACSEAVVAMRPQHYQYRLNLARRLVAAGRVEAAIAHYHWCRRRRANDPRVRRELLTLLNRAAETNVQRAAFHRTAGDGS